MTPHLSPDELVTCLDGGGDTATNRHLQQCESCQASLREMTEILEDARRASDVPEPPSPFWDELGRRIQAETTRQPAGSPAWSWTGTAYWIPVAAAAAVLVIVTASKGAWWAGDTAGVRDAASVSAPAEADPTWETMSDMASGLSADDVRLVVGSSPESTVSDLTPSERDAFVRLLGAELGKAE